MRLTADYQLSSDIMQESFTQLLARYTADQYKTALLYRIARNAALDAIRRKARMLSQIDDMEDGEISLEQQYLIREEYQGMLKAMHKLGTMERDILLLTVSREFTYKQIARIMGISEANVKVKVHRARLKLKQIISEGM